MTDAEELELLELEEKEYQFQKAKQAGMAPPKQVEPMEKRGLLQRIGETVDSYTGAPARASIGAVQRGENPFSAFGKQFGEDPQLAPTGKEIAQKAGISDKPLYDTTDDQFQYLQDTDPLAARDLGGLRGVSRSGAAGLGIDVAADPTNALPFAGSILKGSSKAVRGAGKTLTQFAEKSALNATGATAREASKFSANAGRELLDRGLIKAFDTPEKIATRTEAASNKAAEDIASSLSGLDQKGAKIDANDIYNNLRSRAEEAAKSPAKQDVATGLEKEIENLVNLSDRNNGLLGFQEAEGFKRDYNRKAGNWMDPEKSMVGKEAYQAYKESVENAAKKASPELSSVFEEGKKTYGLLEPIREAAERRSLVTRQSPMGGFMDTAAALGGHAASGSAGAFVAPVARRVVAPRISSTTAVTADTIGGLLEKVPELKQLADTNPQALQAVIAEIAGRQMTPNPGLLQKAAQKELDKDSSTSAREKK